MFKPDTLVKVTSGPHKRSGQMTVEGVEGDRVQVYCPKLNSRFTFPAKLLKVESLPIKTYGIHAEKEPSPKATAAINKVLKAAAKKMNLPPKKEPQPSTTPLPVEHPFVSGGRVAAGWNAELMGTVKMRADNGRCEIEWDKPGVKIDVFDTALKPLPKPIEVGDRVYFRQYWHGEVRDFEGIVTKIDQPPGTAMVDYKAPPEYEVKNPLSLQGPIAMFSLKKISPREDVPLEPSEFPDSGAEAIAAQIAAIEAEGDVAPDCCWIDWKPQAGGFRQWVWRSNQAIFDPIRGGGAKVKTSYIRGAAALGEARAAVDRRNRINKLKKQLERNVS